jgi:hypothetical protein
MEVIKQYLPRPLFLDECRREVISKIITNIITSCHNEEESLAMLFWHSSFLEQPLSDQEVTYCRTLLSVERLSEGIKIDSLEMALEILEMSPEKILLSGESLVKEAKRAYWLLFHRMTGSSDSYLVNVRELLLITKAFRFIAS